MNASASPPTPIDVATYRAAGWDLIPLNKWDATKPHPKNDTLVELGKAPVHDDWPKLEYGDSVIDGFVERGHNVGVRLTATHAVVDYDPRNDDAVRSGLAKLLEAFPFLRSAPCAITGSGGFHFYIRLARPERLRNRIPEFGLSVEVKSGRGRQVVAVGSRHPNGSYYRWEPFAPPLGEAPVAPEEFVGAWRRPEIDVDAQNEPGEFTPEQLGILLSYLNPCDFRDHDSWLEIGMACWHATNGLGIDEFVDWSERDPDYDGHGPLIRMRWQTWEPEPGLPCITWRTLMRRVGEAGGGWRGIYTDLLDELPPLAAAGTEGENEPRSAEDLDDPDDSHGEMDTTPQGAPYKSPRNVRVALRKMGVSLSYDEFACRHLIEGLHGFGPTLDDAAVHALWVRMDKKFGLAIPMPTLWVVLYAEARRSSFHPVRRYLDSLEWDGVERIDSWLITYGGADDTPLNRAVGRLQLIAAVRRVRDPGCKKDEALVFESEQGRNKSTALQKLAVRRDWYTDSLQIGADGKVAAEQLQGRWIVELAELQGMKKSEVERVKAFLATYEDSARHAYARARTDQLRQCVFFGSTNSERYRRDDKNRRFWPVRVGTFDVEVLARDVDQLWAEAAAQEAEGESLFLDRRLWSDAAEQQEARRAEVDPWVEILVDALEGHEAGKIRTSELRRILNGGREPERLAEGDGERLARCMAQVPGWTKARNGVRFGDLRQTRACYFKGASASDSLPELIASGTRAVVAPSFGDVTEGSDATAGCDTP